MVLRPLLSCVLGALFLGERVGGYHALGALVICAGVGLVLWARHREPASAPPVVVVSVTADESVESSTAPAVVHSAGNLRAAVGLTAWQTYAEEAASVTRAPARSADSVPAPAALQTLQMASDGTITICRRA